MDEVDVFVEGMVAAGDGRGREQGAFPVGARDATRSISKITWSSAGAPPLDLAKSRDLPLVFTCPSWIVRILTTPLVFRHTAGDSPLSGILGSSAGKTSALNSYVYGHARLRLALSNEIR